MNKSVEEVSEKLEEIIDYLNSHKGEKLYITRNGKIVVKMEGILHTSKRIGVAKEEMKNKDITLEELNSIDVSDSFN